VSFSVSYSDRRDPARLAASHFFHRVMLSLPKSERVRERRIKRRKTSFGISGKKVRLRSAQGDAVCLLPKEHAESLPVLGGLSFKTGKHQRFFYSKRAIIRRVFHPVPKRKAMEAATYTHILSLFSDLLYNCVE